LLDKDGNARWHKVTDDLAEIYFVSPSVIVYRTWDHLLHTACIDSAGQATESVLAVHSGATEEFETSSERVAIPPTLRTGIFSMIRSGPVGVVRKYALPAPVDPAPATVVFSGVNGGNVIVSWQSEAGSSYQVQKSGDLATWTDVGVPITGTGETMTYSEAATGGRLFLRVVVP
jgi:hypothetical protein